MNQTADIHAGNRKPRILWASFDCLLDTSSGAAISAREMLIQLERKGYEIEILGTTTFDSATGLQGLQDQVSVLDDKQGQFITIADHPLKHQLFVTRTIHRSQMGNRGITRWLRRYTDLLHEFKPDLVIYYGGQVTDWPIADEARGRGIPVAFYLVNGNYSGTRWCRDVDLILTDSKATCQLYQERSGINVTPIGKFIDKQQVLAPVHTRKHVLFINPSWEKGVSILILVALQLEKSRPDIMFEVVESRGSWQSILSTITAHTGQARDNLRNITLTSHTDDMRPVYSRARMLLAPSLWWESGGRVLAESLLNGIPAMITDRGGMPEIIEDAGYKISFPGEMYEHPYQRVAPQEIIDEIADWIIQMFDNQDEYDALVAKACETSKRLHCIEASTAKLEAALWPLLQKQAGDLDLLANAKTRHRQGKY